MARSGLRVLRFVVIAVSLILVIYKLSAQRVDLSEYVHSSTSKPAVVQQNPGTGTTVQGDKQEKPPAAKAPSTPVVADPKQQQQAEAKMVGSAADVRKNYKRANATFVTLARNEDLWSLTDSIKQVEDRFNHQYGYDWVFLNDKDFTDEFKEVTSALITGKTHYGKIGEEQWGYPEWIDQEKAARAREEMERKQVIYGGSVPYRHMCRYESGFFWRHELMNNYKYYWRVEPDIKLFCDIPYDLFKFMEEKKKKYAFTISLYEYIETIPTLWETTKKFLEQNPGFLAADNGMKFISDDGGDTYNRCHFWSNFEIADLDFWRGEAYTKYFDFLDKSGGFFYERWGDAPVHSIGAALFLNKNEIHHFDDVGYFHVPFNSCPTQKEDRLRLRCVCNPADNFAWKGYSCTPRFYDMNELTRPKGWVDQTDK